MRGKTVAALVAALWLGGCAAHIDDKFVASDDFKASGKGIVVLDATPLASACHRVVIEIAEHRTAQADWRSVKFVTAHDLFSNDASDGDHATEFSLDPGEYGMMQVTCEIGSHKINMVEKIENESRRSIFGFRTQFRRVVPTPLATFSVAASEVVDIGSVSAHQTGPMTFVLQRAKPTLASAMVTRLMIPAGRAPPAPAPSPVQ